MGRTLHFHHRESLFQVFSSSWVLWPVIVLVAIPCWVIWLWFLGQLPSYFLARGHNRHFNFFPSPLVNTTQIKFTKLFIVFHHLSSFTITNLFECVPVSMLDLVMRYLSLHRFQASLRQEYLNSHYLYTSYDLAASKDSETKCKRDLYLHCHTISILLGWHKFNNVICDR